ncbi:MAG: hypothetical protein Q4B77_02265 [Coriobacteriaceae bacterium]|nr:hypothetical protein [Coriobacteriaceae bacterium]
MVYEPTLDAPDFFGSEVTSDLEGFKARYGVIVANRWSDDLADVADKVYTRDLLKRDQVSYNMRDESSAAVAVEGFSHGKIESCFAMSGIWIATIVARVRASALMPVSMKFFRGSN